MCKRKRGIKHDLQVCDLITCLESVALYKCGEDLGWSRRVGECQCSVLTMLSFNVEVE